MERKPCPRCGDGAVRREHVIKGERAEIQLVCDLCAFAWAEVEDRGAVGEKREES